jgi:DNA-directed RNA polymerase specialized sigma24 family protein
MGALMARDQGKRKEEESGPSRPGPSPFEMGKGTALGRLFNALVEGDKAALHSLLPPLRERLLRLARKRIGGTLPEGAAEETVQETLSVLWEKRESVREPGHLMPFVFQVLRHKVLNAGYRARREERRQGEVTKSSHDRAGLAGANPEVVFQARELDDVLKGAIEACAEENPAWGRMLQLLREGQGVEEIRAELGDISVAALYTRLHRARKRLKEILRQKYGIDLRDWFRGG